MERPSFNIYHGLLPSFNERQATMPVSYQSSVPRSYHHPSDESDGLPRASGGAGRPLHQDDTPYIPRRDDSFVNQDPQRQLMLPPDMSYPQPVQDYRQSHLSLVGGVADPMIDPHAYPGPYNPQVVERQPYSMSGSMQQQQGYHPHHHPERALSMPYPYQTQRHNVSSQSTSLPPTPHGGVPQRMSGAGGQQQQQQHHSYPPSPVPQMQASYRGEPPADIVGLHPSAFGGDAAAAAASNHPLPDPGEFLRLKLGLKPGDPITLWSLPDPEPGHRPPHPYPLLVRLAIYGSPHQRLTLKQIYEAIENRFEYYRNNPKGAWKGSIRHNLSLNQVFRNVHRPLTEPGKGNYWEIDHSKGEGYKRDRKRKSRRGKSGSSQSDKGKSVADDDDDDDYSNYEIDLGMVDSDTNTEAQYSPIAQMGGGSGGGGASPPTQPRASSSSSSSAAASASSSSRIARRSSPYSSPPAGPSTGLSTSPRSQSFRDPRYEGGASAAAAAQQQSMYGAATQYAAASSRMGYAGMGGMRQATNPSVSPPDSYFSQFHEDAVSSPEGSADYGSSGSYDDASFMPSDAARGKRRLR